ncbi:MAG: S-layer homology domain-containing protein [Jaaginema sp. PMC 1079.18]|nr:S-layer homology domain-containing protein [Jaaginema sp. PMC 1080.18]MEC4851941.1 S-layer homology domain-containing protein [Jaaginema sp. PMC 1079.18]MEC4868413.1 S-layer homology domain-containing protein [Jaaginema sp. PMC 1078.18]
MTTIYINPTTGNDKAVGSQTAPLKTVTAALKRVKNASTLYLSPGIYDRNSGEIFPLQIPSQTIVAGTGNAAAKVVLRGGGEYDSPSFKTQNITVVLATEAQLRGVTVTNPNAKGTGVWVESTAPIIAHCRLQNCGREGIFVAGNAKPIIEDNVLIDNAASGIFLVRQAKGEVRRNLCQNTGYGIALSDESAPLIASNRLWDNRAGIHLSRQTKPVLQRNSFLRNREAGVLVKDQALPDLGSPQSPAGNIFADHPVYDLDNQTRQTLISAGNQINPALIGGSVELVATLVADGALGPTAFGDIENHWAELFIDRLAQRGIISGFADGTFRPEASLTRSQYAALIAQTFDLPRQLGRSMDFEDVESSFWAAKAIATAAAMGFISGFGDGTFRPDKNLTRVQGIVSIVNGLGLTGGTADLLLLYRDRALIPPYATNAIATATQKRLVVNYPDTQQLNPMQDITRAEIAALLYQALVATQKANAIASPYLVNPDPLLPNFTDLQNHWAADFVRRLGSLELIGGFPDGSFRPDNPINRVEYAALLVKVLNPNPIRPATQFIDIPVKFWGLGAIQQAYRAGYLSGFPDRTFHPEQILRRVHLILSLASGLNLPPADLKILEAYGDRDSIPEYAQTAVAAATAAGLVALYPKPQNLDLPATRAEAAAMMYQALVFQKQMTALDSPYIVSLN